MATVYGRILSYADAPEGRMRFVLGDRSQQVTVAARVWPARSVTELRFLPHPDGADVDSVHIDAAAL